MVGLGIVGLHINKLCSGCEIVPGHSGAAAICEQIGENAKAVAFLPPMQIHNNTNGDRMFLMDPFTMRPRFTSSTWITDGRRLHAMDCGRAYIDSPGVKNVGNHAYIRYAPLLLKTQSTWQDTDDPSEALSFVDSALAPVSDVEYWGASELLETRLKRGEPLESMPAILVSGTPTGGNEKFRIRASSNGTIERITLSYLRFKPNGRGAKDIPRLDGLDYAVQVGQEVRAGQLLFSGKNATPRSRGYKAMSRVWKKRIFVQLAETKYVRLMYVKAYHLHCPVCFAEVDERGCRYCAHKLGKTVKGLPMIPDLRLEAGRRWVNYTGDMSVLQSMIQPIRDVPAILALTHEKRRSVPQENLVDTRLFV